MSITWICDTETTGLPGRKTPDLDPAYDLTRYSSARMVSVFVGFYDDSGTMLKAVERYIRPDGQWSSSWSALQVHKITDEYAQTHGVTVHELAETIMEMMGELEDDGFDVQKFVAHNVEFDRPVILTEFVRAGIHEEYAGFFQKLYDMPTFCTMKRSKERCQLKTTTGKPKWPKLSELYQFLFNGPRPREEGAHTARVDTVDCARCYFRIVTDDGLVDVFNPPAAAEQPPMAATTDEQLTDVDETEAKNDLEQAAAPMAMLDSTNSAVKLPKEFELPRTQWADSEDYDYDSDAIDECAITFRALREADECLRAADAEIELIGNDMERRGLTWSDLESLRYREDPLILLAIEAKQNQIICNHNVLTCRGMQWSALCNRGRLFVE
jgi:DNA polymerase III epsilon subunit-like protein